MLSALILVLGGYPTGASMSECRDLHSGTVQGCRRMLTPDEIRTFHDTGWILKPALFDTSEIAAMRDCFSDLERMAAELDETGTHNGSHFVLGERDGQQVIKRVVWAGGSQPFLLEIGSDDRLTVPAAQLLQSADMDQLLSQAHFKRPNDGVIFGWHQDIQHRDKGGDTWRDVNGRGSFVQTLIAIDAMTPDSGPLHFIPGRALNKLGCGPIGSVIPPSNAIYMLRPTFLRC